MLMRWAIDVEGEDEDNNVDVNRWKSYKVPFFAAVDLWLIF